MSDNTMKNSTEVIVEEDEENYETIIYHGRSTTEESNSTSTCQNNAKALCNGIHKSDSISSTSPQASAHDIESPDLVRKNFNRSACISSRSRVSSSGTRSRSDLPAVQLEHTPKQTDVKLHFGFPQMVTKEYNKQNHFQEKLSYLQERVEIIDDIKKDTEETTWEYWPKKYIEESGFCLGVVPGNFYKRGPYFYVTMPHRSSYEILVTNNKQIPCNVDVYVDGKLVSLLRLPAGVSNSIDGPMYSEFAFKLFRSRDAPPHLGIVEGNYENGILKAIFTPQNVEAVEERSIYRLLSSLIPFHESVGLWTNQTTKNYETIAASTLASRSDDDSFEGWKRKKDEKRSPIPSPERSISPSVGFWTVNDKAENDKTTTASSNASRMYGCNLELRERKEDRNLKKKPIFSKGEYEEYSCCKRDMRKMNDVVEGVTILQGIKKKQHYLPAPQMETDLSKQVILILRLVASTKEEIEASNEKVSSLEPPPLPSRR
ncbi:hypothetical protein X975_07572, partial [Stegodyphus mimosarum]